MVHLRPKETVDIVKELVESIDLIVTGKSDWIDNTDGTFTLNLCKTYWFSVGDKFEDEVNIGVFYTISDVVKDTSITITSNVQPSTSNAKLTKPLFYHGTVIAATNELTGIRNQTNDTYPVVYLLEQFDETYYNEENSLDRLSNLRIFFLLDSNYGWQTPEHYEKVITPMRSLLNYFVDVVLDKSAYIDEEQIDSFDTTNRVRFGVYRTEQGNVVKQLSEDYSGIELRINLPILKANCVKC